MLTDHGESPAFSSEFDPVVDPDNQEIDAGEASSTTAGDEDDGSDDDPGADIAGAFFTDVASTARLDVEAEKHLAREVVVRRLAIARLLRGQRRLVHTALGPIRRGLIHPEEEFREREALLVLREARRQARSVASTTERRRVAAFVARLEAALLDYRVVRDRMVVANVRLVIVIARRYRHPTLSFLDLVQEGTIGLLRAIEKFDPDRSIKFSTYAVWWIWQQIARASDCQGALIRTPVHWNQLRRKLGRLTGTDDQEAERQRLAANEDIGPARVAAMTSGMPCISLASPVAGDEERTLESTLPAPREWQPESTTFERERAKRLAAALDELPEREATILRLRFGVDGDGGETLDEIGSRFGVSRERIRQLEARALRQMRTICEREGLDVLLQ